MQKVHLHRAKAESVDGLEITSTRGLKWPEPQRESVSCAARTVPCHVASHPSPEQVATPALKQPPRWWSMEHLLSRHAGVRLIQSGLIHSVHHLGSQGKKRHDLMTEMEDLFLLLIRWGAITQRVLLLPGFEFLLVFFLKSHAFSGGVLSRCSNSYSFGNRGFRITDCIFDTWGVRSQQKEHYSRNKRTAIQKEQNHQPLPPSQVFKRQGGWVLNSAVIRSLNTLKREAETLNLGHKSTRRQSGE